MEFKEDPMRILILGAGAMGCLYGGSLAEQGYELLFADVSETQITALNQQGLRLVRNQQERVIPVAACRPEEVEGAFDYLFLFTKGNYSRAALKAVKHILDGRIAVITLQNGLGNQEIIAEFLPKEQIVIGMTGFPADLWQPGCVRSEGDSFTAMLDADGSIRERTIRLGKALTKAGLNCRVTEETPAFIWEKLAFNAAVNALTCVTLLTTGEIAACGGRDLAFRLAAECLSVAKAKGIPAQFQRVQAMLEHAFSAHSSHKPSMLQDRLQGKPLEIEFLNGAVLKEARKESLTLPCNEVLYQLIKLIQAAASQQNP